MDVNISINGTDHSRISLNSDEKTTKFLGIYMDTFSWRDHMAHINTKISRKLFAIRQARNVFTKGKSKTLYFALIQSHINYDIFMGKCLSNHIQKDTITLQKPCYATYNQSIIIIIVTLTHYFVNHANLLHEQRTSLN